MATQITLQEAVMDPSTLIKVSETTVIPRVTLQMEEQTAGGIVMLTGGTRMIVMKKSRMTIIKA